HWPVGGRPVVLHFGLPSHVGVHDVVLATDISHATCRERYPASVMRPIGTRVVPWDVGELGLPQATRCHDIDVEGAYAVISSDEVTNIPITWPPPPQTGGRPEARATGLVACSSGPGGNGIEDGRAIGENGGVGQLDHPGPVRIHDENIFVAPVAGAGARDLPGVRRTAGGVRGARNK